MSAWIWLRTTSFNSPEIKLRAYASASILQCPVCAYETRAKTSAMYLGNIIGTYGSQSIQSNWDEGWQKVFKNKKRKHHKSRSKG